MCKVLTDNGFAEAKVEPNVFHADTVADIDDDIDGVVHGDDFLFSTVQERADELDIIMKDNFDIKLLGRVGPGAGTEAPTLKRKINFTREGFFWEADTKHADELITWASVETARPAPTPGTKETTKNMRDAMDELPEHDASSCRSAGGKGTYLSLDRPDLMFTVRVVSKDLKAPKQRMLVRLKRMARYLARHYRLVWCYRYQVGEKALEGQVDSDWAGDEETRNSTTCVAEMYGGHLLDFNVNGQASRALSSAEAELYAHCAGGGRLIHTANIYLAFGQTLKRLLRGDITAAQGICRRKGAGRLRHLEARDLWIQDKVADGTLELARVSTHDNVADCGTKFVPAQIMWRHLRSMNLEMFDREGNRVQEQKSTDDE